MAGPSEEFLSRLQKDFGTSLAAFREEVAEVHIQQNAQAWLSTFEDAGLPTHASSRILMLAVMYQMLDLADGLDKESFEAHGWSIFMSLLDTFE